MDLKKLLSISELIEHMKSKGILFNITSEEKAAHFLVVKSEHLRANRKQELLNLIKGRMVKHKEYYLQNATLRTTYIFIRRILKNILKAY